MADRFHKMHGLGNDFVLIDARAHPVEMTAARARAIRTGAPESALTS
jgi:diaminopimelate epimerase